MEHRNRWSSFILGGALIILITSILPLAGDMVLFSIS